MGVIGSVAEAVTRRTFEVSAAGAAWILVGYPLFVAAQPRRGSRVDGEARMVSIVVAGLNEREVLAEKLRRLDDLEYPADRLDVLVAVDQDHETAELARAAAPRARVFFQEERGGKISAIHRILGETRGEIVVFTDANNILEPQSIAATARHFADPEVAVVVGRRGEQQSAYDRYEDLLRRLETRSGSVAAANGEFIAVRRDRLPDELEGGVVNDDFWLFCRALERGGRAIYEPQAGSVEEALGIPAEMERRARMGAGRVSAVREVRRLPPGLGFRVVSHKFGRLLLPPFLLGAFVSSLALARRPGYRLAFLAQAAVYGAGVLSALGVRGPGKLDMPLRACRQFLIGNIAVGRGLLRGLRGRQTSLWTPVR